MLNNVIDYTPVLKPLIILMITLLLVRFTPTLLRLFFTTIDRASESITFVPGKLAEMVQNLVPPLRFFIAVLGIWLTFLGLGIPEISTTLINNCFLSLLVITFFWAIVRVVDLSFEALIDRIKNDEIDPIINETIAEFGNRLTRLAVLLLGLSFIVQFWGYNFSGIVTGLGIGGLAVALAAQETISNMIGYISIIIDRPYEVGDYVETTEVEGIVEGIGFRSTKLRRFDRALVFVPNSVMARDTITNWTSSNIGVRRGRARVELSLKLDRTSDADAIHHLVEDVRNMLMTHPRAVQDLVVVNMVNFGDGWLEVLVVVVVNMIGWSDLQDMRQEISLYIIRSMQQNRLELFEPH